MRFVSVSAFVISILLTSSEAFAAPPPQLGTTPTSAASVSTPTLVRVDGQLRTPSGDPRTGSVALVVSLYSEKDDAAPLWSEQQTVMLDAAGRYTVFGGSTLPDGVPQELLNGTTPGRWIGVAAQGEPEQFRMMLVTVPYAAKAREADTLSGKRIDEFVLTSNLTDAVQASLEHQLSGANASGSDPGIQAISQADGFQVNPVQSIVAPGMWLATGAGRLTLSGGTGGFQFNNNANSLALMNLTNGGNLGIGTAAPQYLLHVAGGRSLFQANAETYALGVRYDGSHAPNGNYWIGATNAISPDLLFSTNAGSERMRLTNAGNVGLGTDSPLARLDLQAGADSDGSFDPRALALQYRNGGYRHWIRTRHSAVIGSGNAIDFFVNNSAVAAGSIGPGSGSTHVMTLDSGKVGIGTTAPSTPLDVAGAVTLRGSSAPSLSPAGQGRFYFDSGTGTLKVSQNGGAFTDLVGGGGGFTLPFAQNASSGSNLFDLTQTGTGGIASFTINNASNGNTGLRIERNGTGIAFQARNIGTSGEAAVIQIDNSGNPSTALTVNVNGTGNGAVISGGSNGIGLIVSGNGKALEINGRYRISGANFASGDTIADNYGATIVEVICNNPGAACAADATPATINLPANPELGSILWITTIDPNGVTVQGNIKGVASVTVSQNVYRGFIFWGGSGNIFTAPQWRPFF